MNEIVILGAGYTGMTAALTLAARTRKRDDVHITLVNPRARFTERLRLHRTGTGQEQADLQIPKILAGTGIEFVVGWVTAIDVAAQSVRVDDEHTLRYDSLVYALGSVADTDTVPGVEDCAHTLDGPAAARSFAARLAGLEDGATVVVGGSGFAGVEAAAEIAEQRPSLTVTLVGRAEPGATMGAKAQTYLIEGLRRLGVRVRAGVDIVKVLPGAVELSGGEHVDADAVLWTAGVRVSPLAAAAGLAVDDRGRIVTDAALRSVTAPNVYAVGDAAAVRQNYGVIHGTCQSGMPTAAHAANTIARELAGKQAEPFRFGYLYQPVSLGRNDAVVQFTRPDDTPSRYLLTGKRAVVYKEIVSKAPWEVYGRINRYGAAASAFWRKGGRATRIVRA